MVKANIDADSDKIPANAAEYKSGFRKWLPVAILSLAMMIIIIDTTVLNVSLRTIVNDLGTNLQGIQWVITGYALTLAALTITGGRLGDLYGRKKMFIVGAIIFAIGSFITSISNSIGMMLIGEALIEGIGAALMLPATASLLVANYKGKDRAIAFGVWGGVAGASSAIGPILGGFLTTNFSWRWAFRINIVVVLVLLVGAYFIAESRDRAEKKKLDIIGVILSSVGLLSFVYGIIESSTYGWWMAKSSFVVFNQSFAPAGLSPAPIALAVGTILLVMFGLWQYHVEKAGRTPLVSLKLFLNRQFTSGSMVTALMSLGMVGLIFAVPVFLQSVQNLDALQTGMALLPLSLTVLVVAPGSAVLTKWFTSKRIIQAGLFIGVIASAVLYFSITATSSVADMAPGLALFGLGMGLVFAQASNLTLSAVSVEESGEASGVNNTLRQIGSSLGSAIIGAVLLTTLASSLAGGVTDSTVIPQATKAQLSSAVAAQASSVELSGTDNNPALANLPAETRTELVHIAHQASADGSKMAILYTGGAMFLAFTVAFALPNVRDLEKRGKATPAAAH